MKTQDEILKEYELVKKAQSDILCFSHLYTKFYKNIFRFIYKKIRNSETAADITSHVFLKAMTNIKSYTFKGNPFAAWLYRIAYNEVVMHIRRNDSTKMVDKDIACLSIPALDSYDFESEEKIKNILNCIKEQNAETRQLIQLRFFSQLKYAEIARQLGLTENNVKIKLFRIINKLKAELCATKPVNMANSRI